MTIVTKDTSMFDRFPKTPKHIDTCMNKTIPTFTNPSFENSIYCMCVRVFVQWKRIIIRLYFSQYIASVSFFIPFNSMQQFDSLYIFVYIFARFILLNSSLLSLVQRFHFYFIFVQKYTSVPPHRYI